MLVLVLGLGLVAESVCLNFVGRGMDGITLENDRIIVNRTRIADVVISTLGITTKRVSMEIVAGIIIALMLSLGFRGLSC